MLCFHVVNINWIYISNGKTQTNKETKITHHKNPQQMILGSIKTADLRFGLKNTPAYFYIDLEKQV